MEILEITCGDLDPIMRVLRYLLKLFKIAIPIVLIVLIIIDFAKATIASDEKKMNEAKNAAGKRVVYALIIFLVPTIISLLFKTFDKGLSDDELTGPAEWISCFNRFNR